MMLDAGARLEAQVGADAFGGQMPWRGLHHVGTGAAQLRDDACAGFDQLERNRGAVHVAAVARGCLHGVLHVGIAH